MSATDPAAVTAPPRPSEAARRPSGEGGVMSKRRGTVATVIIACWPWSGSSRCCGR